MSIAEKAKRMVVAVEIPRDQLALRIAGKCLGLKPPKGTDATRALDEMNLTPGADGNGMGEGFRRAADAAVLYFHECVNAGKQPS